MVNRSIKARYFRYSYFDFDSGNPRLLLPLLDQGLPLSFSHGRLLQQCETNLFGTINLTRSILPYFRQKRSGILVFIGSLAGWVGGEASGPYCTTKFALEGL